MPPAAVEPGGVRPQCPSRAIGLASRSAQVAPLALQIGTRDALDRSVLRVMRHCPLTPVSVTERLSRRDGERKIGAGDSPMKSETSTQPSYDPTAEIARELELSPAAVAAVIRLLDEGATVPFIARYRKEATAASTRCRSARSRSGATYLLELDERRRAVLAEIGRQGKLTPELEQKIREPQDQGRARRSVPAVQAEAPHARA